MSSCSEHGDNSNICHCFDDRAIEWKTPTAQEINAAIGFPGLHHVRQLLAKFHVIEKH